MCLFEFLLIYKCNILCLNKIVKCKIIKRKILEKKISIILHNWKETRVLIIYCLSINKTNRYFFLKTTFQLFA